MGKEKNVKTATGPDGWEPTARMKNPTDPQGKKGRGEGKAKGACRVQQVKHRKTKIITLKHTHLLSYLQADDGRSRNTKLQSEPTGSLVSP